MYGTGPMAVAAMTRTLAKTATGSASVKGAACWANSPAGPKNAASSRMGRPPSSTVKTGPIGSVMVPSLEAGTPRLGLRTLGLP